MPDAAAPGKLQALLALERRHDLFSNRFQGWSTWRVMRNLVFVTGMGLPLAQASRPRWRRVLEALRASLTLAALLTFGRSRTLLVKTCRSALRMPQAERFRDVYFDGLLAHGNYSCLKLEEINSDDFDRQAKLALRPADLDPVTFTFWGRILGSLFPSPVLPFCEFVAERLAREVGVVIAPATLRMRVSTVHWQARLYSLLLRRLRPDAVLVADTGEFALRIACGRRGLRFIELQHGVFDAHHPDAVPSWVTGSSAELVLPDALACRGDFWIDQLVATRQGHERGIAVGNELIDLARQSRHERRADKRTHVVVTSQGLDTARLAVWISEAIAHAPADSPWHISIKLHPVYDTGTRDFDILREDARVHVVGGSEQPNVFDLLADADLHLSISSACHFDAAALGVPTMVMPLAGHEGVVYAVDGVQIFLAAAPADIWALAMRGPIDAALTYRFAKPGFVENLQGILFT